MGVRNPAPSSSYAPQRCNRRRGTTDDSQSGQLSQSKCTVNYSRLPPYIPSFNNLRGQKMHLLHFFSFIPSLALSLRHEPCQNTTCRFCFIGFSIFLLYCSIISTCVPLFLWRPYFPASNKLHSKHVRLLPSRSALDRSGVIGQEVGCNICNFTTLNVFSNYGYRALRVVYIQFYR